jgi:hypothetical protein
MKHRLAAPVIGGLLVLLACACQPIVAPIAPIGPGAFNVPGYSFTGPKVAVVGSSVTMGHHPDPSPAVGRPLDRHGRLERRPADHERPDHPTGPRGRLDALIATTIGPDGTSSMLVADQIHPTNPDGRIALAQLEWNAIRAGAR